MFFTKEKLFLAFLMNRCTKGAVRLVFDRLEKRMGTYEFASVFEYILTDRGSEFGDPDALETGVNGIQRSSIYYCDPMQSGQKGGLEQAHTMLRMILPKGTCFEFLTQWDINLIVSHINSTPRESLGGRTPYSVALETLGEEVLNAFQLRPIAPDEVNLTPKLIQRAAGKTEFGIEDTFHDRPTQYESPLKMQAMYPKIDERFLPEALQLPGHRSLQTDRSGPVRSIFFLDRN